MSFDECLKYCWQHLLSLIADADSILRLNLRHTGRCLLQLKRRVGASRTTKIATERDGVEFKLAISLSNFPSPFRSRNDE